MLRTLAIAAAVLGLASGALAQGTLALLPYPRQVEATGGELRLGAGVKIAVASADAEDEFAARQLAQELRDVEGVAAQVVRGGSGAIVLARGNGLPAAAADEGYRLEVTSRQARVVAPSAAGIFYGVQTLRQLLHPAGPGAAAAPAVRIVDWPALRWRAVQPDLSRGPIPSLAAFERDLPLLGEMKINALVLYFENTFAYQAYPIWSAPGGAIDAAEAAKIVAEAGKYHITVIPEQEAFGHVHLGLQEEWFQNLAETPYGHVLSPAEPASLDFIGKMFAELAPAFPGPFFHIGADETAELGTGRSQEMQKSEGAGALYLDYLKDIDAKLQPYHRKVLFWGDIAQAHPELLSQLPKDMIAVPWDYGVRPSYDKLIRPFTNAGLETWVAPGVSNWSMIFPDESAAEQNIAGFARDGRRLGAVGLLNTTWNDDGESMFDYCWYGIADGAANGWEDAPELDRFQAAFDWAVFRADGHNFEQAIENLSGIHALLRAAVHRTGNDSLVWTPAFTTSGQDLYARMAPAAHQIRLGAESVLNQLAWHRSGARRNAELLDPVVFAARRFDYLGEKAIYAQYIAELYAQAQAPGAARGAVGRMFSRVNSMNGLLQDMRDQTSILREQYKALWLEGNTPYFLDNILVRYDAELMYWQQQARRFDRLSAAYAATGKLPPLLDDPQP